MTSFEAIRSEWERLAREAMEPNPYFEPGSLLPALRHLCFSPEKGASGTSRPRVLTFWKKGELVGLFPIVEGHRFKRLPVRHWRLWSHIHCFYGAPLVRPGMEHGVIRAFYDWHFRESGHSLFVWNQIDGEGPFRRALAGFLDSCPEMKSHSETFARPVYRRADACTRTYEEYLADCLSSRHRKDLLRKIRRLRDMGRLEYAMRPLPEGEELERWMDDFLALEAGGWKGRSGTAMACRPEEIRFFKEMLRNFAAQGRLEASELRLDGRMISAKVDLRVADGLMSLKVAFDEEHARLSPGSVLRHLQHEKIHGSPDVRWIDSCSCPEYRRGDRLMRDSRTIETLCTSSSAYGSALLGGVVPLAVALRRALRGMAGKKPDPRELGQGVAL